VNNEFKRIWKAVVTANVGTTLAFGGMEGNNEKRQLMIAGVPTTL
jgi:hypothetical protein